jgi:competence protein CoiA
LETWEHQQAKEHFAAAYRARGLVCDIEAEVLSIDGDRRADVLLHAPGDAYRVALEVQHTTLDFAALESRTAAYLRAGVPVIWIPILVRKRLGEPQRIAGTNIYYVSHYSAPPWQAWIHDLQGRLWFYDPIARGAWRALLDDCMLYRNPTSWFADGEERSAGGDWYSSERWSSLFLEGPYDLSQLRVRRLTWHARKRRSYRLPMGIGADFMLADEAADYSIPVRIGAAQGKVGGGFFYYRVEYRADGRWVSAALETAGFPDAVPCEV